MTKTSLISVTWVLHCVVYGQFTVDNPYYNPYTSTFVNRPTQQYYDESPVLLGENYEFRNTANMKNLIFQGAISMKIKQLEATTASLTRQLKDTTDQLGKTRTDLLKTQQNVSDLKDALKAKADKSELDKTNTAISGLNDQITTKADKSELDKTNTAVSGLNDQIIAKADKSELDKTNTAVSGLNDQLITKADKLELEKTNTAVSGLNDEIITKADKLELEKTNTAVSGLNDQIITKADKSELEKTNTAVTGLNDEIITKADKSELEKTNTAVTGLNDEIITKADKLELEKTNTAVSGLSDKILTKADKSELEKTNTAVSAIVSPSSLGTIPSSCGDLKSIGYVKSGIYSVVGNKQIQNVYCDFTKALDDTDFQKLIGYVNVKSKAVYFFAQRDGNYADIDTGIPFNKIGINAANALDTSTGEFEAPSSGKYFFAYTGLCWDNEAKIQLQTSSGSASWSKIGDSHCSMYNTLAITSTLQLAKGDRVRIFLIQGTTHDDGNNFTNYVGWLLEEDIV